MMKRKIILACICLALASCSRYYKNYNITDVELRHIVIDDSLGSMRNYYLLKCNIDLCNPEVRFFSGGGVEPGLDGIYNSMENLKIYDERGRDVTDLFKGWSMINNGIITDGVDSFELFSSPSIFSLVKSINLHEDQTRGTKMENYRIFYVNVSSSNEVVAKKIYFKNKQKDVVEDTNIVYKVIYPL
jgi:hypothetical protein